MNWRFLQLRSLKTRVTLFALAIFLGGIWSLSFYTSRMLQDDMQHMLGEQQLSVVSATASHLNRELTDRLRSLETIAKEVDADLIGHPAALQVHLAQRPLLQLLFNAGAWFSRQDGIVVASNLPSLIGTNYADREYMIAVLKAGKSTISKPITGKVLKDPIIVMAAPIRDAQGRVIGALAGVTDLSKPNFLDDITGTPYGKTGGYFIIALQHRLVVTATDKSRVMQTLPPPGINPAIDRFINGYEGYDVLVNAVGAGVLSSSKVIAAAPWAVSASLPTAEAFEPIRTMQQRMLLATLFLTLLASGLTWWILKRQLSPLIAAADAMITLSNANQIPPPLPVTSQDEIGQLIGGFNRLIEIWTQRESTLKKNETELRQLIETSPLPMIVATPLPEGRTIMFNRRFVESFGYAVEDIPDLNVWWPTVYPDPVYRGDAQNRWNALIQRMMAADLNYLPQHFSASITCKDGTKRFVEINLTIHPERCLVVVNDITDRKQAEAALLKSEEHWKFAIEGAGDGLWDWNIQSGQAFYSPHYKTMLGYADDEIGTTSDEWSKRIHPDDAPGVFAAMQPYMDGKPGSASVEFRMLCKDGSWQWTMGRAMVVERDADGKPLRMIGTNSDITKRKQAEKALRQSETHYRTMFDSAPEGVWMIGPDRRTTEVNQRMCDLIGYTPEELLGRNPVEFADEQNGKIFEEKARIVPNRQTRTYEIALRHRDGHNIRTEFRATNLFNEDGSVMGVMAFVVDLTVRKQAEERLQLAANVFDHAREGITITDAQGIIIDVNDAFSRITGYLREEALGQSPSILKSGRQDKAFYDAMWQALTAQGHWSGEIWNRRQNGEVYAEFLTISSVRDAAGAVQQYVGLFSDITERKAHQSQLEHIAHFDALTNLPNRVLLADRLQQAMAQAQRRQQQLAVAYLDLDGFKAINDHHGHETGDHVLITLATRMKEVLREGDTLARMGGDEFVAVLIDLEDTGACVPLLTRLLTAAALPVRWGELNLQVSASLGVTFYPQAQELGPDQLLRQADQAMYQAKMAGKNRYHLFDTAQASSMRDHHESLERIRVALGNHEFVLHYQPKVNMRSGQVIGAEALIRWQHPEKGLLAPAMFLPVIEDHALAVAVGEWVIDTALTQIERWHAQGLDLPVSVNIGARQLQQSDFVDRLHALLAAHPQVKPGHLELEVLETSALEDIAQVSQVIEDCARIGVTFALDDFGTGYSSLSYLKRLRVTLLKIDQSFVRDMLDDADDLAILQGVIGLAVAFRREVIAEGVETVAHGSALLHLGCELAQGYGIARPMPAEQMPAWASTWQPDDAWCELPWLGGVI